MAQKLVVVGDPNYSGTQATVNAQLDTLNNANPVSLVSVHGSTNPDIWASAWAQGKGIPWLSRNSYLNAAGNVDPASRALAHLLAANPNSVLTVGSGAHPTAAAATANKRGHTLTQI